MPDHVPFTVSPQMWGLFAAIVVMALLIDFFAMRRQGAHRVGAKEAAIWSLVWVAVSLGFMGWLWWQYGGPDPASRTLANAKALEFLTGYVIEKSLAVDNIFVFLLIFTYFQVPPEYQKRLLMIGILGALVLRAILILVGAWLLTHFHGLLYLFGAFLIYTGIKVWRSSGKEPDLEANTALKWLRKRMKIATTIDGEKFFTQVEGVRMATPLFVVILMIGIIDVVFAVDSIPAIFAVTTDPFIVLTSNVFAILGLRAMFFLLASAQERFHLLSYGLAIVLAFIGTKMLLPLAGHWIAGPQAEWKIPIGWSLTITLVTLAATMALSLVVKPKGPHGGAYPFPPKEDQPPPST